MTAHRIELSYPYPPLHANQRIHWTRRAKITKALREEIAWKVKAARIGRQEHITVGLEYAPATVRKRDGGENLAPTLKVGIDGIVQAGCVIPDTPQYVTRLMPVLLPVDKQNPGVWLTIDIPGERGVRIHG